MLEVVPKDIKRIFVIVFIMGIIAFFLGLLLDNKYMYIAYTIGNFISIISNLFLLLVSYRIAYKSGTRGEIVLRYIIFYIIYAVSIYLIAIFMKDKYAVLFTALGLVSFRIVIYLYHFLQKLLRK
ncbi:hypothetical protein [Oceanivirga salmonicida]|uniref:hypothetical protein n=1 Tax=Oceanivirga salmonicida TaxID=1769291 RepID=UPI00083483A7|nr:hypothetical protein [Oceanivirga salmonicida]